MCGAQPHPYSPALPPLEPPPAPHPPCSEPLGFQGQAPSRTLPGWPLAQPRGHEPLLTTPSPDVALPQAAPPPSPPSPLALPSTPRVSQVRTPRRYPHLSGTTAAHHPHWEKAEPWRKPVSTCLSAQAAWCHEEAPSHPRRMSLPRLLHAEGSPPRTPPAPARHREAGPVGTCGTELPEGPPHAGPHPAAVRPGPALRGLKPSCLRLLGCTVQGARTRGPSRSVHCSLDLPICLWRRLSGVSEAPTVPDPELASGQTPAGLSLGLLPSWPVHLLQVSGSTASPPGGARPSLSPGPLLHCAGHLSGSLLPGTPSSRPPGVGWALRRNVCPHTAPETLAADHGILTAGS